MYCQGLSSWTEISSRVQPKIYYPTPTKEVSSGCLKYRVTANSSCDTKPITLSWTRVPKTRDMRLNPKYPNIADREPSTLSLSSNPLYPLLSSYPSTEPPSEAVIQSPQTHHITPNLTCTYVPIVSFPPAEKNIGRTDSTHDKGINLS
jgi:hypothetical protein